MRRARGFLVSPDGPDGVGMLVPPANVFDLVTPTFRKLELEVTPGSVLRELVELERDRWNAARTAYEPYGLYAYFADRGHLVHYPPHPLWEAAQAIGAGTLYRHFGLEGSFEAMHARVRREVPAVAGCGAGRRIAEGLFGYRFGHMKLADESRRIPTAPRASETYEQMARDDSRAVSLAQRLYDEDGLAAFSVYEEGVDRENIDDFVAGNSDIDEPPATIVFEGADDLVTKLDLRVACRRTRIPCATLTELGRLFLVDFYDFDRMPDLPLIAGTPDSRVLELLEALREAPDDVSLKQTITTALVGGTEAWSADTSRDGATSLSRCGTGDGVFGGVVAPRLLLQKVAGSVISGRRLLDPLAGEVLRQDW